MRYSPQEKISEYDEKNFIYKNSTNENFSNHCSGITSSSICCNATRMRAC